MKFDNIPTWLDWQRQSSSSMTIRATKPKLVRIDNLIKKYHQVLDMGRLNILMELKDAIIAWTADKIDRDASTGRLEAMQALQEIVLKKLHELDNWCKHRYLKAACIGYRIKTGDYDANKKPPSDTQRQKDETIDIGNRVRLLSTAIAAARTTYQGYLLAHNIPGDEDRKTLKIFMAPEFFFRGPYGAYRDIGWVAKILSMMRAETGTAQYADWLFVHGSALFSTEKMVKGKSEGMLLENYALVQKGGPKTNELQDFFIAKEFPSHVDFQHPTVDDWGWYKSKKPEARIAGADDRALTPEGGRKDPVNNPLGDRNKPLSELVGGCIFTMDSITFGLEVCRDHYLRRLASSRERGRALIQLVPSAGMSIEAESVACAPAGIIFNVDGVTPHVEIEVNSNAVPAPAQAMPAAASGGGDIVMYTPVDIPWPGPVRADVAKGLNLNRNKLSGTRPVPPPKPAWLPRP